MRVNGVVVLHPAIDESESCGGIRNRTDPDIVSLEGLHEGLGHAIAFGTFHWREARLEVESHRDLKGAAGGEDRAVVCQPLHLLRCSDVAKPPFDALNHHVPDHLAGNPGRGCHPADDFAIMAVQREGDPDNLAAPTGELQDIRTPSLIGTAGYDGAIMDTRGTPPGMPGQEKPVLLHQPVDPLGIDGIEAGGSPLALEERGDPPVSDAYPPGAGYRR